MYKINIFLKLLFAFMVTGLVFTSCLKDHSAEYKAAEKKILAQFLEMENITVSPTKSGLYFIPEVEGTGLFPGYTDWVEFSYTGRLVSDTNIVIMTSDSLIAAEKSIYSEYILYGPNRLQMSTISLNGLGEGLTLMKAGGKARIIFPSDLGYGSLSIGLAPAYSSLIFDLELLHVIKNIALFERGKMKAYLESNNITEDTTSSGLIYHETLGGTGEYPKTGQKVSFTYKGSFLGGKVFQETAPGEIYSLSLGYNQGIKGMEEGLRLMKKGGKAKLVIPYYLAYGEEGYKYNGQILIWPYTTLVFDIEVLDIQ